MVTGFGVGPGLLYPCLIYSHVILSVLLFAAMCYCTWLQLTIGQCSRVHNMLPCFFLPPSLPPCPLLCCFLQVTRRQAQMSPSTTRRKLRRATSIGKVWTLDWTSDPRASTAARVVMVQETTLLVSGCWAGTRPRPAEGHSHYGSPPSSPVTRDTREREVIRLLFATPTNGTTTRGRHLVDSPSALGLRPHI